MTNQEYLENCILGCVKKVWGKTYAKRYAPNSVRYEVDDDIGRYCIYINNELYEMCPISATKREAEMRLQDIMFEKWIEGDLDPTRHEIK
jgi:hypothetical protein